MVQVPGCGCSSGAAGGGSCASAIVNAGYCRVDTGDPVLVVTVVSCNGSTISTIVTDLSTGDEYLGPIDHCGGDCCDEAATSALDTDSIDLSLAGNVLSADLKLDPASPSPLTVTANGLYVDCCDDAATNALDTDSIDLSLVSGNLSAELNIDPASPAPLSITANGLSVGCCDETVASVSDTDSVDLSIAGDVLSADVRIDPASTAPVSVGPDGIKIDCCADANDGGWTTQVKLGSQSFNSTVHADINELPGFTPVPNGIYEVEYALISGTSLGTIAPQPRLNFPLGMTNAGSFFSTPDNTYVSEHTVYGGPVIATGQTNAPVANVGFLQHGRAIIDVGPTPGAGAVRVQMASETGATVFSYRGSMFKWRRLA